MHEIITRFVAMAKLKVHMMLVYKGRKLLLLCNHDYLVMVCTGVDLFS